MQLTERLKDSITVLYNAFHNGTLNTLDCKACAVGNMCRTNNKTQWSMNCLYPTLDGAKVGIHIVFNPPTHPNYSTEELFEIERLFLTEWEKEKSEDAKDKEIQFNGLCAVVEYLCKLDNVPNVMDIQSLFEYEGEKAKNELIFN